jgi:hypothetical protein
VPWLPTACTPWAGQPRGACRERPAWGQPARKGRANGCDSRRTPRNNCSGLVGQSFCVTCGQAVAAQSGPGARFLIAGRYRGRFGRLWRAVLRAVWLVVGAGVCWRLAARLQGRSGPALPGVGPGHGRAAFCGLECLLPTVADGERFSSSRGAVGPIVPPTAQWLGAPGTGRALAWHGTAGSAAVTRRWRGEGCPAAGMAFFGGAAAGSWAVVCGPARRCGRRGLHEGLRAREGPALGSCRGIRACLQPAAAEHGRGAKAAWSGVALFTSQSSVSTAVREAPPAPDVHENGQQLRGDRRTAVCGASEGQDKSAGYGGRWQPRSRRCRPLAGASRSRALAQLL